MPTKTLKARVEIDGAREYKQQLAELNSGHRVLASEMKLLQEQYKGSEQSMEAMTAKSELLERQLLQQRDKVKTLQEALQDSAERYGEADRRTQSWQIQLNNAQREEIKLQRALEDTNKALNNQGEATETAGKKLTGLGDSIDSVAQKFGVSIPEGAKNALNGVEGFSAGTVAKMAGAAAAVAAVVKVTKELSDMTLEAAEKADALLTRSAQTGLDTGLLQGLDYAQRFLDFDGLDKTLVKLTQSMDAARDGAEKQAAAFEALGVSVTDEDGKLKNNFDTFTAVIDALGNVADATERDALANDLFGKSYAEMKPLIAAGSEELRKYTEQAKENGLVLSEYQIKKLGEVDDAHQELQAQIDATKNKMAVDFAPATKAAMDTFANAVKKGGDALVESRLIENLGSLVQSTASIFEAGSRVIDALPSWLNPIDNLSRQLHGLATVAALVADSANVISGLVTLDFGRVKTAMGLNLHNGEMSNLQRLKYSGEGYNYTNYYNASGTDNWRGGLTWVGDAGPEIVELPQGTKIHSNQESRQMISAGTDTRQLERLLGECVVLLRQVKSEVGGIEVRRRMA